MKKRGILKGWHRALIIILPYIYMAGMFAFLGGIVSGVRNFSANRHPTFFQTFVMSVFHLFATVVVLGFFMYVIDGEPFMNLGLRIRKKLKDIIIGLFTGLLVMISGYSVLLRLGEINYLKTSFDFANLTLTVGTFILVSIIEEILFRGYILRNLMYSFNKYFALLFSSILFSLMHSFNPNMDWFSFLDLFLAGILLGVSYIYTKNLWFPIALHFSWNFFQSLFGFNVSGQDFYSLIEFNISEKNILNGGDFGFEGSVFSIIIQIILIFSIFIYYQRKRKYHEK